MNHNLSREDFRSLVRGEIVELRNGDKLALSDIGYTAMWQELSKAMADPNTYEREE